MAFDGQRYHVHRPDLSTLRQESGSTHQAFEPDEIIRGYYALGIGPLPPSKRGHRSILVMTDRFRKLTQVVAMKKTTVAMVAAEFCLHWVYKYGAPKETLTDNGP